MKKNLTLLMMLAAFVGILSAQSGPKFNYQAVVRNADTLVYNQSMTVTLTVTDGTLTYTETFDTATNKNGFLSLAVGGSNSNAIAPGTNNNFNPGNNQTIIYPGNNQDDVLKRIDWSKATITAKFQYDNVTLTSTTSVKPVPYAIMSGAAPLTTERIAGYLDTVSLAGAHQVLDALVVDNTTLEEAIETAIVAFLKTDDGKAIMMDVAKAYTDSVTVADIHAAYGLLNANTEVKDTVKGLMKDFILDHRTVAKELAIWYLEHATQNDFARAYATLLELDPDAKAALRAYAKAVVEDDANRDLLYPLGYYYINHITSQEAEMAYIYFKAQNGNGVKQYLKNILNNHINNYVNNMSTVTTPDTDEAIDQAIDNYIQRHHIVKNPDASCMDNMSIQEFICWLKSQDSRYNN